jgi:outer membrane receptor protein involved in Fe transport
MEGALKLYYNFGDHDITDGWHSVDNMKGIMLYQGMKLFTGNTFTAGLDYMHYGGKGSPINTVLRDDQGAVILPPTFQLSPLNDRWTVMSNTAVYVTMQQMLRGKLTLSGGLRYEMNATYGNEWIPQFGLSFNPSWGTSLKASVSKGYRPPSIRELYFFPPANENLQPERMLNYEIGWDQQWMKGRMSTGLTAFLADGDNLIILVPPTAPPPPQYRNSGEFRNLGVESSWHWQPVEGLGLEANYTWIHMKNPLPATPEHNLFVSGRYRLGKWNFLLKIQNIFNLYNAEADGVGVVEKNYQVLGARIGFHATRMMDLFLMGNNLLNQEYQINYAYPMPGISVIGGIGLKLSTHK